MVELRYRHWWRIWQHFLCNLSKASSKFSSLALHSRWSYLKFGFKNMLIWQHFRWCCLKIGFKNKNQERMKSWRQQLRANSSGPENFIAVQAIAHQLLRTVLQASHIHTLPQSHHKTLLSICLSVGHLLSLTSRDWEGNTKKYLECLTKLSWGTSCTIVICNLTWNVPKEMWWCKDPQNIEQKYTTEIKRFCLKYLVET